jgi:alpha-L-rhamnosidase
MTYMYFVHNMKIKIILFALVLSGFFVQAQDFYKDHRANWLQVAERTTPQLVETLKKPTGIVSIIKDPSAYQGWKAVPLHVIDSLYTGSFKKKSGVIIDFGEHLTGHFSFSLEDIRGVADAPLRFKFTFAEVPAEAVTPFDPYEGALSRAWLQDEIITVSEVPSTTTVSRRLAFRYVKIEWLGSSRFSDFRISNVEMKATTSVNSTPSLLASGTDPLISKIDQVGLTTLKECMQTVYEDGPKRDRRLWIGDLYLEALANVYSFKNHELTKHSLYLLAALSNEKGYLNGNVFETPKPHPQANVLFDYALLYNVALKDYYVATNDKATVNDLWEVAKKQIEIPKKYLQINGLLDYAQASKEWWLFFDWRDGLDKQVAMHGVVIYAYKQTYELAKMLGKENEVAELPGLIQLLTKASKKHFYDSKTKVFVSGINKQVSYASQAWMVLSGVASAKEGVASFQSLNNIKDVIYPGAPYLYHYVIEAMIQCGMKKEARQLIVNYWGGMVNKGADTFWEVYDPNNDFLSPYNTFVVNSYCHAWSCTPVYFIRKYPEIFQN